MPQPITESQALANATPATGQRRVNLLLITPGQGSSGYYSEEVLKQAAEDKVFPAGTQSHINHDSDATRWEHPAGDLKNLAAVLTEDARWVDGQGLVAEARVGSRYADLISDFADIIGVSISASADISESMVDGAPSRVVERLIPSPLNRVDFVTVPGRGGKIAHLLEHGHPAPTSTGARVEEAIQAGLTAITDNPVQAGRAFVTITERLEQAGLYTPEQVKEETMPQPETPESQENPTTAETDGSAIEGATIPAVTITEEATGKDDAAREQLSAAQERIRALTAKANRANAEQIITEHMSQFDTPKLKARLLEHLPTLDNGDLDTEAFTADVAEQAAELAEHSGAGRITALGTPTTPTAASESVSDADILNILTGGK